MSLFYNRTADILEIVIRDETGRLIEKLKCRIVDKKGCYKIMKILKDKYGFEPTITPESRWVDIG